MNETTTYTEAQTSPGFARTVILPIAAATVALVIAVIGALIVRGESDIDGINFFVESLSGGAARQLGGLSVIAPLGFAFGAGLAAAFNPCGFAMLPAYMGLYLGVGDEDNPSFIAHIGKALLIGGSVTVGFILLFAAAGAVIGLGARSVVGSVLPWIGLGVGILLTIAGAWLLGGGKLYTALAQQMAEKFGNPGQANIRGYFIFGLAYGLASLSCNPSHISRRSRLILRSRKHLDSIRPIHPLRRRNGNRHHHTHTRHGAVQGSDGRRHAQSHALHAVRRHMADAHRRHIHRLLLAHHRQRPGVTRKSTVKKKRRPPIGLAGVSYPTIFPQSCQSLPSYPEPSAALPTD